MELQALFQKILWLAMGLSLLALFDELNRPARPPKKKQRQGIVHWDEARGEKQVDS